MSYQAQKMFTRKIQAVCEECPHMVLTVPAGPKDVLLKLNVSDMDDQCGLSVAMKAAKTIVNALTIDDRISIVASSSAKTVGDILFIRASKTNKDRIIAAIKDLKAGGGTNFHVSFNSAFYALDRTMRQEYPSFSTLRRPYVDTMAIVVEI